MIYPFQPMVLNFEAFQAALHQLDQQITLVYLIGPNGTAREKDLACLDEVHRTFYRSAVQAFVIDLRDSAHWPELVNALTAVNANLPAAAFEARDLPKLKKFFDRLDWRPQQLFLIDPSRTLPRPVQFQSCRELRQEVRAVLKKQSR